MSHETVPLSAPGDLPRLLRLAKDSHDVEAGYSHETVPLSDSPRMLRLAEDSPDSEADYSHETFPLSCDSPRLLRLAEDLTMSGGSPGLVAASSGPELWSD
jgi:hypothetical protein